jgi:hypothetical protein
MFVDSEYLANNGEEEYFKTIREGSQTIREENGSDYL